MELWAEIRRRVLTREISKEASTGYSVFLPPVRGWMV